MSVNSVLCNSAETTEIQGGRPKQAMFGQSSVILVISQRLATDAWPVAFHTQTDIVIEHTHHPCFHEGELPWHKKRHSKPWPVRTVASRDPTQYHIRSFISW